MLFTELRFLFFFAATFGVHWLLPRNSWRKVWLLICSYAFYAGWDWRFLGLILLSTAVDFVVGLALERQRPLGGRAIWVTASLIVNLGILGLFKYFDFFAQSAAEFFTWMGLPISAQTLELTLPVGISFYTFQTLSYTIDVYRGRLKPIHNPLDFAVFVAFFPQLVAGPIVRATEFLPQLTKKRHFGIVPIRFCLTLFLAGYVKKACIADNIAAVIDPVFASPGAADAATLWLAMLLYGIQIYCDFSGYSDMAIATGGLLGYNLPLNFNYPYTAGTITEFWRRWHISLSTWFRDYLYIPLGGSRRGSIRVYFNLAMVFFLCGLWHGASWNFVIWGLLHGVFLIGERVVGWTADSPWRVPRFLYAQLVAMLAWVVFRCTDMGGAVAYYSGMIGLGTTSADLAPLASGWWVLVAVLALLHFTIRRRELVDRFEALPDWAFAAAYGIVAALVLPWVATDYQPFIYFQF